MQTINRRRFVRTVAASTIAAEMVGWHAAGAAQAGGKIKVGQIGTKHAHASGKVGTMRKFSDLYDVVGVVEADEAQRRGVADSDAYRGLKWMSEEELLNTPGLQAVAVETEVRQLLPTAARCAAAGLHIHLDKPAGEKLSEFKRVLDETTRHGRVLQMGYMFRYNPAFQFLFRAVREGWLGELFEVHAVISKTVNDATRKRLARYAGGSMFELGCHLIDAVVAVAGPPDRVTAVNRRTRPDDDDLLDNCLAVFEYPRATATVRSALVEVDGGRRRQLVVCGRQGTIEIKPLEPPRLSLTLDRPRGDFGRGSQDVPLQPLGGRYDGDFLDLARIIRGEKSSDYPPAHDLAVQAAVLHASGLPLD